MNRGSAATPLRPCPVGTSFNEAPIHESGKFTAAITWMEGVAELQ